MTKLTVPSEAAGQRLDVWLSAQLPELSRARVQALIRSGHITADGRHVKPHHKLAAQAELAVAIPAPAPVALTPEALPLDVLYEDADIIVVNKPAGLVVHPAAGHASGTLVNALLAHCGDLAGIGGELRPGIVHRLDRDTSGAMVVAKHDAAMQHLVAQFKQRRVQKEYMAVVWGVPRARKGRAETLIGRSPHDRKKMSARPATGRPAVTTYEVTEVFPLAAALRVKIETGRTHQIRVHLAYLGHPVVGDTQYGRRRQSPWPIEVHRQMLHAERLAFVHPRRHQPVAFVAPLPQDMRELLDVLRQKA